MSEWDPGIPLEFRNAIVTGDSRDLAKQLPAESVDLIFTDPVYWQLEDYRWLSREAARVLKPNSAALVWSGKDSLPLVMAALGERLSFAWLLIMQRVGGGNWGRVGTSKYEPLLWYEKGASRPTRPRLWDFAQTSEWPKSHPSCWDKPQDPTRLWLDGFTAAGAVVWDPFAGSGTVPVACKQFGRNFIGFEIDPETAALARERVLCTQAPLLLPEPEPPLCLPFEVSLP